MLQELNFPRLFLPAVDRRADEPLFVDLGDGTRRTYAEHLDRTLRLGHALRNELGLRKEDRFGVLSRNNHEFLELWHTAFFGAATINPLNTRLGAPELTYILRDSGTKVVFADALFAPVVEELREAAGIDRVVLLGPDGDAPHDVRYEDLVAAGEPEPMAEPDEEDAPVLMYTGGTTGRPRGVVLQQRAQILNIYKLDVLIRIFTEAHVTLMCNPMFHVGSCVGTLGVPAGGGTVVIQPGFEPGGALEAIEEHGVTHLGLVPSMYAMLLRHPDFDAQRVSSVRVLGYGAAPMPPPLLEQLMDVFRGADIMQTYGMTEASACLTHLSTADHHEGGERLKSVGRPLPGVALRIVDEHGDEVPRGVPGEVWVRSGNTMRGYWKQPEATATALAGGWYHTGDMGYLDERGYLFLVDRVKDMIVSGGENVYSLEVENAIATHPSVAQVAVVGIPHDIWGEAVHAVVVTENGADVGEDDIKEHARAQIASYKVPKSVEFRTEPLPLSGAGKVLKRELREPFWKDRGRLI